jgi:hypothetical protein
LQGRLFFQDRDWRNNRLGNPDHLPCPFPFLGDFDLDCLWGQNLNVAMTLKVCAFDIQTVLFDSASAVLGIL